MSGSISLERNGAVATVVIDNVEKRNAMSHDMWARMGDVFFELGEDDSLRCIVLRGRGDTAFGSGGDISQYTHARSGSHQAKAFAETSYRAMRALRDCPVPTVAAIRGVCVGGAFQLAGLCDMRLCSDDSRFGLPLTKLGVTVSHFELAGIMRFAGFSAALELLLEGRIFGAQEAYAKGLVTRVVTGDAFDDELGATVARIASGAPLAARWHKKFARRMTDPSPLSEEEIEEGYACFDTEDYRIGCQSFLSKTAPSFVGR